LVLPFGTAARGGGGGISLAASNVPFAWMKQTLQFPMAADTENRARCDCAVERRVDGVAVYFQVIVSIGVGGSELRGPAITVGVSTTPIQILPRPWIWSRLQAPQHFTTSAGCTAVRGSV